MVSTNIKQTYLLNIYLYYVKYFWVLFIDQCGQLTQTPSHQPNLLKCTYIVCTYCAQARIF